MGTTRGTAGRAGLITQGYGGPPFFIRQALLRGLRSRLGSSSKREFREFDEVIAWAKLIMINDKPPVDNIEGFVTIKIDRRKYVGSIARHVGTRVRKVIDDISVFVKRLK